MPDTHAIRQSYKGSITDTDRWQHFQPRAGDVFVCTPPKSGTTWTTSIVTMLAQASADVSPQEVVQWVDAEVVPLQETLSALQAQTHQRCIKTHTPFDGIPWRADAKYIAVYRHPIDMLMSLRKHLKNSKTVSADHAYLASLDDSVTAFIERPADLNDFDFDCLETLVHHYKSYWAEPQPSNLLFLHYADMLADAHGTIEKIAEHMALEDNPALIDAVHKATAFDSMKSQAEKFAPFAAQGYWRDPKAFFDSSGTHKWQGKLKDETLSLYKQRIAQLLNPAEVCWLEQGGDVPDSS